MLRLVLIMAICSVSVSADSFDIVEKHKDSYLALWEIVLIIQDDTTSKLMSQLSMEERSTIQVLPFLERKKVFEKIYSIFMLPFPYEGYLFNSDRQDLNKKRHTLENLASRFCS